jgi:hypothetical protein
MSYQDKVRKKSRNSKATLQVGGFVEWCRDCLYSDRPAITPRTVLISLMAILLGGTLACQVIWQHVRYTRASVTVNQLEQRNHKLKMKIQQKELVVSRLERLDRIQRIAINQLGLKPLDETPVIEMSQTHWVQSSQEGDEPVVP